MMTRAANGAEPKPARPAVMALTGLLLAVGVGFPAMGYWDRLNRREAEARQQLQAIQTRVEEAAAARASVEELRHNATLYPDRSELRRQSADMLQQVQQIPGYSELVVRRLEVLPPRREERYYQSGVSLQFGGSLAALHQFLQELEGAQPQLKVETLIVSADKEEHSRIDGQMVIHAFAVVTEKDSRKAGQRTGQRG